MGNQNLFQTDKIDTFWCRSVNHLFTSSGKLQKNYLVFIWCERVHHVHFIE